MSMNIEEFASVTRCYINDGEDTPSDLFVKCAMEMTTATVATHLRDQGLEPPFELRQYISQPITDPFSGHRYCNVGVLYTLLTDPALPAQ